MKRSQLIIIGIGVLIVLGMCIMPPFHFHRSSKYLPIWTNTAGRLDITRLCVQIGAVAILTGGLVFLVKRKWNQGNEGNVLWGKMKAIDMAIIIALAISAAGLCKGWARKNSPLTSDANRLLTSMDLSKVKLEPLEIWADKYLKCRLYNGTDKALNELQVSLYVITAPDQLFLPDGADHKPVGRVGVDGKRGATLGELLRAGAVPVNEGEISSVLGSDPQVKLTMVESEHAPPALWAREYRQDFAFIGPVPPASWSEVDILLSNCPEVKDRSHWQILFKGARWQ